ncbi:zinc finger, CCHC-type containing protein [Tanacetum coccineum]|uniref:Zinc finger, CCHC-type containing protein n=1 Tax=Tanacetum coccineum TaxID=301880 RepID=A0ABQ5AX74_9ASTR
MLMTFGSLELTKFRIKLESNRIVILSPYYIEKVLNKFNYFDCTLVITPIDTSEKLMPNNGQAVSQLEYSRMIGCLIYAITCTRPDIAFAVGKLSSGWVFLLGGGAISWASKKQTCIIRSIIEYEFVALAAASKEAEWLRNQMSIVPPCQKKMHFLLSSMSVVYVLTTPILEDDDDAIVEQLRKRAKWDNDDYAKYMVKDASSKKFLVSNFTNYKMTDSRPVMEQYNELFGILRRFTQHKMNMDEPIQVSCIIDKLHPSWKDFKHTLKHLKEELTLVELGSHLRIKESLRVQDNDKPKRNNVVGPSVVNMVEHNNSSRDCKGVNVGNKANGSCIKVSVDGSSNSLKAFMSTSKLNDSILWHARLGHVHFKRMQDMSKDGLIPAFDMNTKKCKTCMLTKITKKPFQNVKRETKVLELIHSDLCDLHATPSLENKIYFVIFIDDASRFCYVYLLHTKDEALDKFKVFKTEVELQQGSLIKRFRTDKGGEYTDTLYFQSIGLSQGFRVVRLHDPKLKTFDERGIECIFVRYAEHSNAFRFFVIKPNESVSINYIIESRDAIFDKNRFSSVPKPSLSIPKGTEDIGGLVVPKKVTEEVVQQPEPELRKSKKNRTSKNFGPEFQLYLIEGTRDEVSDQHSYCFNVKDYPKTFNEAMKSHDVAF